MGMKWINGDGIDSVFLVVKHYTYLIMSNIGAAPIEAPPRAYLIFHVPIGSTLGH